MSLILVLLAYGAGYWNGHTGMSAWLAFLAFGGGLFLGRMHRELKKRQQGDHDEKNL